MSRVRVVGTEPFIVVDTMNAQMAWTEIYPNKDECWGHLIVLNNRWQGLVVDCNDQKPQWSAPGLFTHQLDFSNLPNCVLITDKQYSVHINQLLIAAGHDVIYAPFDGQST